nr:MAG TPA: hypothetical protein [Caudoviricetes sp.]
MQYLSYLPYSHLVCLLFTKLTFKHRQYPIDCQL